VADGDLEDAVGKSRPRENGARESQAPDDLHERQEDVGVMGHRTIERRPLALQADQILARLKVGETYNVTYNEHLAMVVEKTAKR